MGKCWWRLRFSGGLRKYGVPRWRLPLHCLSAQSTHFTTGVEVLFLKLLLLDALASERRPVFWLELRESTSSLPPTRLPLLIPRQLAAEQRQPWPAHAPGPQ